MDNYRITKNGVELFVIESKDKEFLSISCAQTQDTTTKDSTPSILSSEAIQKFTDGKKMLVKWPDIDLKNGDILEIEITTSPGTLEPDIMYQTRRSDEPGREGKCSFCFKDSSEVKKIVFGPDGANICNECIELSQQVIEGY